MSIERVSAPAIGGAVRWFRYVLYKFIPDYVALGWEWDKNAAPLHAPHGCYSVICEWKGEGEPIEPKREGEDDGCVSGVS